MELIRFTLRHPFDLGKSGMTHDQARAILADAEATIAVDEEEGTATISGTVTIEELQAISQLLEYTA